MTTKINASTLGLTETVDTSGILELQTANTTALLIDASQNANFVSTGAITVPVGTTAQRPANVSSGMIRYNTTNAAFEYYVNGNWALANVTPPPVNTVAPVISGTTNVGQVLTSTSGTWNFNPVGYYYQWLANSSAISNATANTFTLTSTQLGANIICNVTAYNGAGNSTPAASNSLGPVVTTYTVNYLVVAGGGAGGSRGNRGGGGGGAGGMLTGSYTANPGTAYTITVGAGGSGTGSTGTNSTLSGSNLSTVTSYGGGGGASSSAGGSGGSGGGSDGAGEGGGGSGTAGQGNNGGAGTSGGPYTYFGGGGGGGAAGTGGNASPNSTGANGGNGLQSSITGTATYYAGGGGGGCGAYGGGDGPGQSSGGLGGGGAGVQYSNGSYGGTAGTANTGGGGGGANAGNGGNGGSGVVIISYQNTTQKGTGGTVTTYGSGASQYWVHTFNSSGTYTA